MASRLKVYRTHLGFFDMIVAAPSQKAALQAWGAGPHQFSQGFAAVTVDPKLVAAALAKPGVVMRRQFGSQGAFSAEPAKLKIEKPASRQQAAASRQRKRRKKAAERQAVAKRLADLKRDEARALRDIVEREADLAQERKALRQRFAERRRQIKDGVA